MHVKIANFCSLHDLILQSLFLVPYFSPSINLGQTTYYSLKKSIHFLRSSVLCFDITSKDTYKPMSISMAVSSGSNGTNKHIKINCTKSGVQTQCKTGTLLSGSYVVEMDVIYPNSIISIQNCADACKFIHKYSHRTRDFMIWRIADNMSISQAENGTWFKGCQTLPNMESSTTEETIISSLNCQYNYSPGSKSNIINYHLKVTIIHCRRKYLWCTGNSGGDSMLTSRILCTLLKINHTKLYWKGPDHVLYKNGIASCWFR